MGRKNENYIKTIRNQFGCVPPRTPGTDSDVNFQNWEPIRIQPQIPISNNYYIEYLI